MYVYLVEGTSTNVSNLIRGRISKTAHQMNTKPIKT